MNVYSETTDSTSVVARRDMCFFQAVAAAHARGLYAHAVECTLCSESQPSRRLHETMHVCVACDVVHLLPNIVANGRCSTSTKALIAFVTWFDDSLSWVNNFEEESRCWFFFFHCVLHFKFVAAICF